MSAQTPAEVVDQLCDDVAAQLPRLAPMCSQIKAHAGAALRVAVVGKVNAGKSTLVNALLGQRIAPTDVSECTRVATWYRFGVTDTAVVIPKEGPPRALTLHHGALPQELGQPVPTIQRIEVTLSNERLRNVVLIDTPGLGSTNDRASTATLELLASDNSYAEAADAADAIIFVFNQTLKGEDVDVINHFIANGGGPWDSPSRVLAVLTKADLLADKNGSLGAAKAAAQGFASTLSRRVVSVVPIVGLLAETVRCGLLNDPMAQELEKVAVAPDRRLLLASPARFVGDDRVRNDILNRLSTFGVAASVTFLDQGGRGAADLSDRLRDISGIDELDDIVRRRFRDSAAVLQAERALQELAAIEPTLPAVEATVLRDLVDQARLERAMHRLAELHAEDALLRGIVTFPAERHRAALQLLSPGSPGDRLASPDADHRELAAVAFRAAEEWHETAVGTHDPGRARIASCVSRSAYLLHKALSGEP